MPVPHHSEPAREAVALLPCPFCGEEAEIERYGDRRQSTIYQCTSCSCSLETGEEWGHGSDWNRRASPAPAAGGLEAALPSAQVKDREQERDRLAKLVESMIEEPTFAKSPHARMAIAIAASNVRRGRLLTSSEKFDNLTSAIEADDPDLAARIRASLDLATDAEG